MRTRIIALLATLVATFVLSPSPAHAQWRSEGGDVWFGWDHQSALTWITGHDGYQKIAGNNIRLGDSIGISPIFEESNYGPSRFGIEARGSGNTPWHIRRSFVKDRHAVDQYGNEIPYNAGGYGYNPATPADFNPYKGKEVIANSGAWWELPDGAVIVQYGPDGVTPVGAAEVKHGPDGPYQKPLNAHQGHQRLLQQQAAASAPPPASGEQSYCPPAADDCGPVQPHSYDGSGYSPGSAADINPYRGKEVIHGTGQWWLLHDGAVIVQYGADGVTPVGAAEVKHGPDGPYQKPLNAREGHRRLLEQQAAASAPARVASPPGAPAIPVAEIAQFPVGAVFQDASGQWWKLVESTQGIGLQRNFAPPVTLTVGEEVTAWGKTFTVSTHNGKLVLLPKSDR